MDTDIDTQINRDTSIDKYTNADVDIDMDEDIETVIVYLSRTVHIVMVTVHSVDFTFLFILAVPVHFAWKVYRMHRVREYRVRSLKHFEHHEDFNKLYTAQQSVEIHGGRSESVSLTPVHGGAFSVFYKYSFYLEAMERIASQQFMGYLMKNNPLAKFQSACKKFC